MTSAACNVEAQRADPDSMLHLVRDLIALRRGRSPTCGPAATGTLADAAGCVGLAPRRADHRPGRPVDDGAALDGVTGTVVAATDRAALGGDGRRRPSRSAAWEAVVVARVTRSTG